MMRGTGPNGHWLARKRKSRIFPAPPTLSFFEQAPNPQDQASYEQFEIEEPGTPYERKLKRIHKSTFFQSGIS